MGCASSAPLQQNGDAGAPAALKAIGAVDAASDLQQSTFIKLKDVGESVKEAAGDVVESVEHKVGEIGNQLGEKVSEVTTQVKDKVTSFLPLPKKEVEDEGFPSDDVHIVGEELTSGQNQELECSEESPKEVPEETVVKPDATPEDTEVTDVQEEMKLEEISDENPKEEEEEEEKKEGCQESNTDSAQDESETVVNDESHPAEDESQEKKEETNPAS